MKKTSLFSLFMVVATAMWAATPAKNSRTATSAAEPENVQHVTRHFNTFVAQNDTIAEETFVEEIDNGEIRRLTEEDFQEVADELGVEVAAIKAIVDIEAGRAHEGFSAPGVPIVNFDYSMFSRFARKRGINLAQYRKTHPLAFSSSSRGGQAAETRRLNAAKSINRQAAIEGTFWGMFQIGGFNWKKCGVESIEEFERLMSGSERDQLELFARFITSSGLLKHLRAKNWSAFARGYNGPSYAARGYHTRLASAYRRHSAGK